MWLFFLVSVALGAGLTVLFLVVKNRRTKIKADNKVYKTVRGLEEYKHRYNNVIDGKK